MITLPSYEKDSPEKEFGRIRIVRMICEYITHPNNTHQHIELATLPGRNWLMEQHLADSLQGVDKTFRLHCFENDKSVFNDTVNNIPLNDSAIKLLNPSYRYDDIFEQVHPVHIAYFDLCGDPTLKNLWLLERYLRNHQNTIGLFFLTVNLTWRMAGKYPTEYLAEMMNRTKTLVDGIKTKSQIKAEVIREFLPQFIPQAYQPVFSYQYQNTDVKKETRSPCVMLTLGNNLSNIPVTPYFGGYYTDDNILSKQIYEKYPTIEPREDPIIWPASDEEGEFEYLVEQSS